MAHMKLEMVLCGAHANKTIVLNGRQFIKGRALLLGDHSQVVPAAEGLKRSYQAFVVDSDEHNNWVAEHGDVTNGPDSEQSGGQGVDESPVSQEQSGVAEPTTDDGEGAANSEAGSPERDSSGNGLRPLGQEVDGLDKLVISAINMLSPTDDEHWTASGLPKVEVVAKISKVQGVSREMINRLAPDVVRAV